MKMRMVGKAKIGREKIHERIYPRLRLPTELSDWIDKKAFVYLANIDGREVILLSQEELASSEQDVGKISQITDVSQQISQISQMEERISRLERAINEIYDLLSKKSDCSTDYSKNEWARGDLNPRSPPRKGGFRDVSQVENGKVEQESILSIELYYDINELNAYTQKRLSGVAEKSKQWINKGREVFWQITQGVINFETINALYEYTLRTWDSEDSWGKIFGFAKSFLDYLAKTRFDQRFSSFKMFLEKPKKVKEKKRITDRIIVDEDIRNAVKYIVKAWKEGRLELERALNYTTYVLMGAYTGQRPDSTLSKLRIEQIEAALNENPPVLHVEAQQDKIRMEHYVPLHPKLIPFLKALLAIRKGNGNSTLFDYMSLQQWLKRNHIPLKRGDLIKDPDKRHFVAGDLRKFAEQMGDIIKWDQSNRAYILTHNVSSIDWERYKHPLPEFVYEIYMEYWGDVDLVPEEAYELLNFVKEG